MISTIPALTDAGKALLLRAIAGEHLTFTRLAIGSGLLSEGQDPDELTSLIKEELSITPASTDSSQAGLLAISGDFSSADIAEDFVWRELGVFARGEDDIELLYAYANDGESAGTLRALTSSAMAEINITTIVEIDDAQNVTAIYSPHVQYAEAKVLNEHMDNTDNPHKVDKDQVGLGNVVNAAPKDMTSPFEEAKTRANIESGETFSVILGKVKKAFTDIFAHIDAQENNPHHVTKKDIGLENVENASPSDMKINFTQAAEELDNEKDLLSGSTTRTLFTRIAAAVHSALAHIGTIEGNPHKVSKKDIGLENVENTSPSFNVVNFDTRNTFAIPASGETMATMMSKIAKDLTDVQDHFDTSKTPNPHNVKLEQIAEVGTYFGDGTQGKTVKTPFTPSAVLVYDEYGRTYHPTKGVRGGLATSSHGVRAENSTTAEDATTWSNTYSALMCTEDGFKVNFVSGTINTNETDTLYHYIAYK